MELNLENLNKLEEIFKSTYEFSDLDVAKKIYDNLNKVLTKEEERKNPELFKKYQHLKAKYGFVCLATLSEKQILDLLESHLAVMLEIPEYNLWENLKKYLVVFYDYKERDRIKNEIKNILIKNKARITKTNLLLDNRETAGTLDNWLRDYHIYLGLGPADRLKFTEYFVSSLNIKRATTEEKERIKFLFNFYEKLKLSSNSPQGFEEKVLMKINGKLQIWKDGRLENLDPVAVKAVEDLEARGFFKEEIKAENKIVGVGNTNDIEELKQLAANYPADSFERKAVEEEINRVTRNA